MSSVGLSEVEERAEGVYGEDDLGLSLLEGLGGGPAGRDEVRDDVLVHARELHVVALVS